MTSTSQPRNFVAKNANKFNKAVVMRNRKMCSKRVRGDKHKKNY